MRKIVVGGFVSLDGVMQAPGGPEEDLTGGFQFGGWTVPYWQEPAMGECVGAMFANSYDLLLGRRTYDIFAAHWPYQDDDIGRQFNRITKYVATHHPASLKWQNSQALSPDPVSALRQLKQGDGPDLLTQGSTELLHLLFANDLVDEMSLLIFPVVLGKGKRLFDDKATARAQTAFSTKTMKNGVIFARYRRGGDVEIGSFQMADPSPEEIERRKKMG
jgi:dihydrofolate reductase